MLMLTELPGTVIVFEQFFHLDFGDSYTCNIHGDPRIERYITTVYTTQQYTMLEIKPRWWIPFGFPRKKWIPFINMYKCLPAY